MSANDFISIVACAVLLALAVLAIARAARSPLALPLALLCLDVFGWMTATLVYQLSGSPAWHWLDHALTPWTAPLALQLVLVFTGRRRALRATLALAFAAGGALSIVALLAFVSPYVRPFVGGGGEPSSPPWALCLLSAAIPTMVLAIYALVRHLRASTDATERARTHLLLAAFAIGTVLGATEELTTFVSIPGLANVGITISAVLLAIVALRFRLFERDVSLWVAGFVLVAAAVGVLTVVLLGHYLSSRVAILLFGSFTVTLALFAAGLRWLSEGVTRRERQTHLATVGRFSAQMAHDLKNPLAAVKGAAQVLREDLERPAPGLDRMMLADLMLDQIARLDRLVDVYGRLARAEPQPEELDLNELVATVLALPSLTGAGGRAIVKTELEAALPRCRADQDMLTRVLENLVHNALEAMPDGGTVTVRTTRADQEGKTGVAFWVQDTGAGMDARTRERAFDDFFTTKPTGSGLGLAFVRRVIEAHGGEASFESGHARGTVVRVWLPVAERAGGASA
jgi:signal transduction histidine kinase